MARIVVFNSMTLDGVMQAPGRPDEDKRGGFQFGGWAAPIRIRKWVKQQVKAWPLPADCSGRRTYEDFYSVWPNRKDNPFTEVLNNTPKYVASTTLKEPLPWMNSTLLKGDIPRAAAALKTQLEKDLVILGSGELIRTLMKHHLIDLYMLLIHPLVLGSGRRLFAEGAYSTFQLVDSKTTPKGVVIATYQLTATNVSA